MYQPKDWGAAVVSISDVIGINKGDGIVVNPMGENLILKEKAIADQKVHRYNPSPRRRRP